MFSELDTRANTDHKMMNADWHWIDRWYWCQYYESNQLNQPSTGLDSQFFSLYTMLRWLIRSVLTFTDRNQVDLMNLQKKGENKKTHRKNSLLIAFEVIQLNVRNIWTRGEVKVIPTYTPSFCEEIRLPSSRPWIIQQRGKIHLKIKRKAE